MDARFTSSNFPRGSKSQLQPWKVFSPASSAQPGQPAAATGLDKYPESEFDLSSGLGFSRPPDKYPESESGHFAKTRLPTR